MTVKHFTGLMLIVASFCSLPRVADAQVHGTSYGEHHHSSTFEESMLYGTGFFLRNLGAGLRDAAEGQRVLSDAQRQYIENYKTARYDHFEAQRLNAEQRSIKRGKPSSAADFE